MWLGPNHIVWKEHNKTVHGHDTTTHTNCAEQEQERRTSPESPSTADDNSRQAPPAEQHKCPCKLVQHIVHPIFHQQFQDGATKCCRGSVTGLKSLHSQKSNRTDRTLLQVRQRWAIHLISRKGVPKRSQVHNQVTTGKRSPEQHDLHGEIQKQNSMPKGLCLCILFR